MFVHLQSLWQTFCLVFILFVVMAAQSGAANQGRNQGTNSANQVLAQPIRSQHQRRRLMKKLGCLWECFSKMLLIFSKQIGTVSAPLHLHFKHISCLFKNDCSRFINKLHGFRRDNVRATQLRVNTETHSECTRIKKRFKPYLRSFSFLDWTTYDLVFRRFLRFIKHEFSAFFFTI